MKKVILSLFVAVGVLIGIYILVIHQSVDLNKAHGTVDIQDSLLSFERSGKIISISVDEGAQVSKGQVLARLDTEALEHQQRIQYSQCEAEQALLEQYQNGYLKEELDTAKAAVAKAQAAVDLAKITYQRNASLLSSKSISQQEFDSSKAAYTQAQAALEESKAQLSLYQRGYREEVISAQSAKVTACTQQLRYLHYQINEQGVILAPFSGTIRSRVHEMSDFVGAGETIFALTYEQTKKIRIYLSENQLNRISLGQTVSVEVPFRTPLSGTVTFISPSAMFTPKSVQTEELRADLVYEVTVEVPDPEKVLRFGQAITVYLTGEAPTHASKDSQASAKVSNNSQDGAHTSAAANTSVAADTTSNSDNDGSKSNEIKDVLKEPGEPDEAVAANTTGEPVSEDAVDAVEVEVTEAAQTNADFAALDVEQANIAPDLDGAEPALDSVPPQDQEPALKAAVEPSTEKQSSQPDIQSPLS